MQQGPSRWWASRRRRRLGLAASGAQRPVTGQIGLDLLLAFAAGATSGGGGCARAATP